MKYVHCGRTLAASRPACDLFAVANEPKDAATEVTPEMIEAGRAVYYRWLESVEGWENGKPAPMNEARALGAIFTAMWNASRGNER